MAIFPDSVAWRQDLARIGHLGGMATTPRVVTRENASEIKPHVFAVEAVDLGIGPTDPFPKSIRTTMGNGRDFCLIEHDADSACYHQLGGVAGLTVEREL